MAEIDLKYYIFDWDDNILFMPTRIHLELDGVQVDVTTKEFAGLRHNKAYRLLNDDPDQAFAGFRDGTGDFVADAREAIRRGHVAPSFEAFKRALIKGRLFSIVTARGHSEKTIRAGVELFIAEVLTEQERDEMLKSIQTFNRLAGLHIPADACLRHYLDLNGYIGVSSPEFLTAFKDDALTGASTPESGKTFAVRRFVVRAVELANNLPARRIAFGFSDDDPHNLATVRRFLDEKLMEEFPNIDFFIYDTSGGREEVEQL